MNLSGPALNLRPRYNVAPGQLIAAVRATEDGNGLSMLRWGLVPPWAKHPRIGNRLINARAETVAVKPAFRAAYRSRRCLIPADGFYEWQRRGAARQPYFFQRKDGGLWSFAGLWERWTVPADSRLPGSLAEYGPGDQIETCTILTSRACRAVAPIHVRMPVILDVDLSGAWLAGETVPLGPYPSDEISGFPVSTLVNRVSCDRPRCAEPVSIADTA